MRRAAFLLLSAVMFVMSLSVAPAQAAAYSWHTFYGPSSTTAGMAMDGNGNIYVIGNSGYAWNGPAGQPPLHPFKTGSQNMFVLKLDPSGTYQWHTFFVGYGTGMTLDSGGNIYIASYSSESWYFVDSQNHIIQPIHAFMPGQPVTWVCWCYFEFPSGNHVCKTCTAYPPNFEVIKLNGSGEYQWHTFYGSGTSISVVGEMVPGDYSFRIAADSSNNIYMSGRSSGSWNGPGECRNQGVPPCPINPFSPDHMNFFVMKLDPEGVYQWHTFYKFVHANRNGAPIAVDPAGNSYITTSAMEAWTGPLGQPPKNAYDGDALTQAVVLKLGSTGAYQWHTFYGNYYANGYAISLDTNSNIYFAGDGYAFVGPSGQQPVDKGCQNSAAAEDNLWVMKLNPGGDYQWHTCYYSGQNIGDIIVDNSGSSYIAGSSFMGLGSPFDYDAIYDPPSDNGYGSALLLKVGPSGSHRWHAYFGENKDPYSISSIFPVMGYGVVRDSTGNIYMAGTSNPPWNGPSGQSPLHAYSTPWLPSMGDSSIYNTDMFVLKMAASSGCSYFNSCEDAFLCRLGLFTTSGGAGSFPVEAQSDSSSACDWAAVSSDPSWLHVTSGSPGSGNGTVAYSVDANGNSYDRSGTITVGGQYSFPVYQQGTGTAGASAPTVTTKTPITGITDTTATGGGTVAADGGATLMSRGVCWNTTGSPTTSSDNCTSDGAGIGDFVSMMSGLLPNSTYHVRAFATNMKGAGYGADIQFTTAAPSLYLLTVQSGGNGQGSVSSNAGGISYSYPAVSGGSAIIGAGTSVTVTANAGANSSAMWYGCDSTGGTSSSATCHITLNAAKTIQVSFTTPCAIASVRKDPQSYYDSIGSGYSSVASGDVLQTEATSFTETLSLDRNVSITLKGGYDCSFSANTGLSSIHGTMTISGGTVTVENIVVD